MHLPNGSQIFIESQRQLQGQVSAIQKGRDAIVTVVGHSLTSGDVVIFQGGGMDGMFAKVQRFDTNRFFLRGTDNFLRSKNFDFVGSLCYKVTAWTEIPCVQDINFEGGEQQYYNYQCLSDDREQQLKTFKSAQSVTITYAWEFSDAVNNIARKADEDEVKRLVYMTIPRAKEVRYWSGSISFNSTVNTTVNEMETTSLIVNLAHPQAQMPELIPGNIPVESITVMIDSLIPGQLQVGEYATRRISLFPATANSSAVDWEISNTNVAEMVSGDYTGVKGLKEGMFELAVTSRDSGKARGALPMQVIPYIPMRSANVLSSNAARRASVGSTVRFSLDSIVPSDSGEEMTMRSSNQGVGRLDKVNTNGRSCDVTVVGASTFKIELWSVPRNVKVSELEGWFFGVKDAIELFGNGNLGSGDTWPTTDAYRNLIKFMHSGDRSIVAFRKAPQTSDFYVLESGPNARTIIKAGAATNMNLSSDYIIERGKVVAIVASPSSTTGIWSIQALN